MACGNWSRIDLRAEPGIAYVAIPRAGSGTLRALLQKLHAGATTKVPHRHACTLRELLETHRARRVLVPLRPLHERIASWFERSRRRNCSPPAFAPACALPAVAPSWPALEQRYQGYLDAAAERFVRRLRSGAELALPVNIRPVSAYLHVRRVPNDGSVVFVCAKALREETTRALRRWGIPGAKSAWNGVADRHVTNARVRLSNASLTFLRSRFAEDYEFVGRYGCV